VSFATGRQDSLRAAHGRPPEPLRPPKRGHYPAFGDRRNPRSGLFLRRQAGSRHERNISREVNENVRKGFEQTDVTNINKTIDDVNRQVQREIKKSLRASKQQGDADKLIRCIQRANQNVNRIQRCSERFQ
jgi:hypothetical protein